MAATVALGKSTDGPSNFGRVRVLQPDQTQRCLVSCGPPIDGLRIRIVDSDRVTVPDGEVGDIQVSGPSIMLGYQAADGTVQQPDQGWHDTGDRGLLSDGELFVVGRSKEMLIVRGRNFPPYDVERAVDDTPGVAGGQRVVFSVPDESRGRECVVAVIGTNAPEHEHVRIRTDVGMAVRGALGFSLDDMVLVRSRSVPRTTSGKLQRVKVRALYLDGRLS